MVTKQKKIRVLLCKPPLDMHSRGIMFVARVLRDAGLEVIYLEASPRVGPSEIVEAAIQEDVDVIGLSILSGSPVIILSRILDIRNQRGIPDIPVIVGGVVPREDLAELKRIGVADIFSPGTPSNKILESICRLVGDT